MAIKDLAQRQPFELIEGEIIEKGEVREFQKFGKPGRVCTAIIKDDTGQCKFSIWNEQIDQVEKGDKVKLENGYASEWQGEVQVSTGRNGTMEVIKGTETKEPKPEPKVEPATSKDDVEEEVIE